MRISILVMLVAAAMLALIPGGGKAAAESEQADMRAELAYLRWDNQMRQERAHELLVRLSIKLFQEARSGDLQQLPVNDSLRGRESFIQPLMKERQLMRWNRSADTLEVLTVHDAQQLFWLDLLDSLRNGQWLPNCELTELLELPYPEEVRDELEEFAAPIGVH